MASHPELLGIASEAEAGIEYPFAIGDRVDVLFESHVPNRSVVEVEVEGERNLIVGVQQASKYQTLAGVEVGYTPSSATRFGLTASLTRPIIRGPRCSRGNVG